MATAHNGAMSALYVPLRVFSSYTMLDGAIARVKGTTSRYGALLDSTCDRLADGAIFAGLAYFLLAEGRGLGCALALWVLIASQMVSYVKARAESLGAECNVGIAERPERLIIILVGAGLSQLAMPWLIDVAVWTLAAGSIGTVGQRMLSISNSPGARDLLPIEDKSGQSTSEPTATEQTTESEPPR